MITQGGAAKALRNKVLTETASRAFNLRDFLFPEQLAFVTDPSPNKIAMCSRRSGKTISCAADLIKTAIENSNVACLYITLSRNNAKKIIWRELKKINRDYALQAVENLSELSITYSNGSIIYLSGAKDSNEIEKFRGLALKLVYIDEAQSFREYIKDLIDEILAPSLMDYAGTLCMIGTPPAVPVGYFYNAFNSVSTNWSRHSWTFFNNPFIVAKSKKTHQQMLDRELARRGVKADDPSIQREWFGKCVTDTDSLLLQYDLIRNDFDVPPKADYVYLLGVDIGHDDADALAVLAWSESSPNIYLVEERLNRGQDITDLMNMIESMRKTYNISKIIVDTGGLGKKITEELIRRHQIPLQAADKVRKMENIALLNDFLRTGRFKAKKDSNFAKDSFLVEIDRDKSTPDRIKVSDKYHSDIIDAVLYAFKESYAYSYSKPSAKPGYGTKEWAEEQHKEMFDRELEGYIQQVKQESEDPFNNWN